MALQVYTKLYKMLTQSHWLTAEFLCADYKIWSKKLGEMTLNIV